ncbi:MAG: hypothetical protein ACTHNS_10160 [Marmoricola sp.]
MSNDASTSATGQRHTAGLFDIRNIVGSLLGIYGIVLVLVGIIGGSSTKHVSGGGGTNIVVGVVLIAVAVFFLVWTRLRPTVVDEVQLARDKAEVAEE